jgi:hypothetical protein
MNKARQRLFAAIVQTHLALGSSCGNANATSLFLTRNAREPRGFAMPDYLAVILATLVQYFLVGFGWDGFWAL